MLHIKQVTDLSAKGLKVCHITGDQRNEAVKSGVMRGEYQIVYFTPEILLKRKEWQRMLLKEVYLHNLKCDCSF